MEAQEEIVLHECPGLNEWVERSPIMSATNVRSHVLTNTLQHIFPVTDFHVLIKLPLKLNEIALSPIPQITREDIRQAKSLCRINRHRYSTFEGLQLSSIYLILFLLCIYLEVNQSKPICLLPLCIILLILRSEVSPAADLVHLLVDQDFVQSLDTTRVRLNVCVYMLVLFCFLFRTVCTKIC